MKNGYFKSSTNGFVAYFSDLENRPTFGEVVARKDGCYALGHSSNQWINPIGTNNSWTPISIEEIRKQFKQNNLPAPASSLADHVKELKRKFDSRQINDEELKELAALISESIIISDVFGSRSMMEVYSDNIKKTVEFRES